MFGGFFGPTFVRLKVERYDPLTDVDRLLASDLAVANLETPVVAAIPAHDLGAPMRFAATPVEVGLLPRHGLRTVTIANNHAADMRAAGLISTPSLLGELGITALGAARDAAPWIRVETVEVRGWKIGFIAATAARNFPRASDQRELPYAHHEAIRDAILPVIAAARADHDLVIVFLHWGREYSDKPSRWQVEAAHAFVDAGADAVIGSHPHVLQGIERYGRGVIAYSLGNFVFQNTRPTVRQAGVLRLGFAASARCLERVTFHPTVEVGRPVFHPIPATDGGLRAVTKRMTTLSRALGTRWTAGEAGLTTPGACP
jgi:poly-gamma-glutamate synthesis protein (capsule biosynthesis protein)